MNYLFNRGTTYLTGEPLNLSGPDKVLLIANQGLTPIARLQGNGLDGGMGKRI